MTNSGHRPRRLLSRLALPLVLLLLAGGSAMVTARAVSTSRTGQVSKTHVAVAEGTSLPDPAATDADAVTVDVPAAPANEVDAPAPSQSAVPPPGRTVVVPILCYHYIRINPDPTSKVGFRLSVTPDNFAAQMAYLKFIGAHPVTFADLMAAMGSGPPLPPHAVVLTFDDGYEDFASAATPILVQNGFIATDYVVSGFIGRSNYMSAQEVKGVVAAGMIVGGHTVHHVALASISPALAQTEITVGKASLEQLIGRPVVDFAYPYGSYSPAVALMVQQAGFRDAVTLFNGYTQYSSRRYTLSRWEVGGGDSLASFAAKALLPRPPASFHPTTAASILVPRFTNAAASGPMMFERGYF